MMVRVEFQKALEHAEKMHKVGDYDRAVRILCVALEQELNTRLPQVIAPTLRQIPLPLVGFRCVQAVMELRIERLQQHYTEQQCAILLNYAQVVGQALPAAALIEKLCMRLHRLMCRCLAVGKWQRLRMVMLGCMHRIYWLLLQRVPEARQQTQLASAILAALLSEPERNTLLMLRDHQRYAKLSLTYDFRRPLSMNTKSCLDAFRWPEQLAYRRWSRGSASRVLTTIHMGDFIGAFNCIATQAAPNWRALTVVRELNEEHVAEPASASVRQQVLRPGQYSATEIVSALRKGQHTLCILFDLREGFGGTVSVELFGHRARTVKGPAALAIAARVPIIPFVTFQDGGIHHLEMAEAIDTRLRPGEVLDAGVARITQQLVGLAEKWIRRFPSQWRFLPQLPLYIDCDRDKE